MDPGRGDFDSPNSDAYVEPVEMSQMEIFTADTSAPEPAHGGYDPAGRHTYRGHQVPVSYKDQEGMRVIQKPTLLWLMDEILEALRGGPIRCREMHLYTASPVRIDVVAKHVHLLVELGLVEMDYRFDEPKDAGRSDPGVIQLPKMGVS